MGLTMAPRSASAEEELLLQLHWLAPVTCPDEAAVKQKIRALLPSGTQKQLQLHATGLVTQKADQFWLHLTLRAGQFESRQEFSGRSCGDVVGAAAVSIALLLRPTEENGEDEQEREPTEARRGDTQAARGGDPTQADTEGNDQQRSSKTGATAANKPAIKDSERVPRKSPPAGRPSASGSPRMVLALPAMNANFGLLPKASLGIGGGAGVEFRRFQALLTGWWTPDPGGASSENFPGTTAELQHARVGTQLCHWRGPTRFSFGPCLDLTVEHLVARGEGPDIAPRTRTATWVALGPAVSARLFASRSFAASTHLGLHFQTSRPVLLVEGQGELGQVGLLNLTASLGAEWIF